MTKMHLLTAAAALALAACGSKETADANAGETANETSAAEAAATLDPCTLVTAEEMTAITGDKVVEAARDGATCTYKTDDQGGATIEIDQADAAGKMEIDRKTGDVLGKMGEAASDQGAAGADANAMLSKGSDAPKLGDEALFGPNSQLSVRKGATYIAITPPIMHSRISYSGNPLIGADDKRKMALAIADKALARIP